jgi:DNA-binding response OmpR family regulator
VDDSRTNLTVIGRRLSDIGHRMMLADNGRAALDLVSAGGVDLVLLDMSMPGISGLDVLHELRASRETSDLPVIMVTGQSEPAMAVAALAAGADDWIAKPFAFEVLEARIDRLLIRAKRVAELKRSNAALDARVAARAIELGETKADLASSVAERQRLVASIEALSRQVEQLNAPA